MALSDIELIQWLRRGAPDAGAPETHKVWCEAAASRLGVHADLVKALEVFADAANYYDDANLSPGELPWRDDHPANPVFNVGQLRAARTALSISTMGREELGVDRG